MLLGCCTNEDVVKMCAFHRVVVLGEFRLLGGVELVLTCDVKEFPICKREETDIGGSGWGVYGKENAITKAHNDGSDLRGSVKDPAGAPWIV